MSIYNEQGAIVGVPGRSQAYIFNSPFGNITYNQTLLDPRDSQQQQRGVAPTKGDIIDSSPPPPSGYGWSVASNNNYPGGCILPIVGSPVLKSSLSTQERRPSMTLTSDDGGDVRSNISPSTGAVYAYMYQQQYGNPWLLDKNITAPAE